MDGGNLALGAKRGAGKFCLGAIAIAPWGIGSGRFSWILAGVTICGFNTLGFVREFWAMVICVLGALAGITGCSLVKFSAGGTVSVSLWENLVLGEKEELGKAKGAAGTLVLGSGAELPEGSGSERKLSGGVSIGWGGESLVRVWVLLPLFPLMELLL